MFYCSNMDLSLDDIIKKKNLRNGNKATRGRLPRDPNNKISFGISPKTSQSNGKVIKISRHPVQTINKSRASFLNKKDAGVVDARLRIIQKNRQRLTDARDKLSELAKHTDARAKIRRRGNQMTQRPDRRRGQVQETRNKLNRPTPQQTILQRSIKNNVFNVRDPSSLIRCTINRTHVQPFEEDMELDSYTPTMPHSDLNSIKIVAHNEYQHYRQENPVFVSTRPEPIYVDHYDQPMFNRQLQPPRDHLVERSGVRMSQQMRDRLDTPAKPPQYNFAQPPQSPPLSQGHRIVVSNLHSSVTHEDIKELFEDIGPLLTSRLVRPGTAEVIYKLQKDAKKAVDAYHNRQLDGQPMKCLLVNPRISADSSGVLRSNNMPAPPKFPVSSKSMVVPDLSAIHKALFTYK